MALLSTFQYTADQTPVGSGLFSLGLTGGAPTESLADGKFRVTGNSAASYKRYDAVALYDATPQGGTNQRFYARVRVNATPGSFAQIDLVSAGAGTAVCSILVTGSIVNTNLAGASLAGSAPAYNAATHAWIALEVVSTGINAQVAQDAGGVPGSWSTIHSRAFADMAGGFDTANVRPRIWAGASNTGASGDWGEFDAVNTVAGGASAPEISLSRTSVTFADATQGGANPPAETVSINNTGTGTLNGLSVTKLGGAAWLTASLDSPTAFATLTLSANIAGLPPGTYTETVRVASTAPGVTNSPQDIVVSLEVLAPTVVAGGSTFQLTASVRRANGTEIPHRAVEWSSDAPHIASVDARGVVTGQHVGTTTVRARTRGAGGTQVESTCTVTVTAPA